ncbi:MAG: hypothetical protein IPH07_06620 [Deltaproteobacteria bacterium]|nr:hypothetical protein [Deltaproteobacteria bacterium]
MTGAGSGGPAAPRPGFDVRVDVRVQPNGSIAPQSLEEGKRHEFVAAIPKPEPGGAMLPDRSRAEGGFAIAKQGEAWSTSAPTGVGAVAIGLPLPRARALTPGLSLGYASTGGNGPFGWGWRLSVPSIRRVSTKAIVRAHGRGVPEYDDELDVFAFGDGEALVKIEGGRHRPRVESSFARIERKGSGAAAHWIVRDRNDVVSIFGRTTEGQIADPEDPSHVFEWLLQEQRDAFGNVVLYRWQAEDLRGVETGGARERGASGPQPQRYLRRVLYGNRTLLPAAPLEPTAFDDPGARAPFAFEVVFDHGQHDAEDPRIDEDQPWPLRPDAFSSARAGFEVRTRRRCARVLVFHRFAECNAGKPTLVRALELGYEADRFASRLVSATIRGYDGDDREALPPRRFTYSPRTIAAKTRTLGTAELGGVALDLSGKYTDAELIDLDGDGLAGLVVRDTGHFDHRAAGDVPGSFRAPARVGFGASPSTDPALHAQRFLDVAPQGRPALVEFGPSDATVFEREPEDLAGAGAAWKDGVQIAAAHTPPVGKDPIEAQHRIYVADLDGDGIADVLVAKDGSYTWWRRLGERSEDGWTLQPAVTHDGDEDAGPGPVLYDARRDRPPAEGGTADVRTEAIVLADMTGDGLPDVVRLRADEVAYWPNLGHGRFGRKVVMDAPGLGEPVDIDRVRLCDVDGLGPVDVLYLGQRGATLWANASGNALQRSASFAVPPLEQLRCSSLCCVDGNTTASFAFAKAEPEATLTIVDFMAAPPYLLVQDDSGFGARTSVAYASSATFQLADRVRGQPWRTRLPRPLSVVTQVESRDLVAGTRHVSRFSYHHGHWDPREREFRGFARVEQRDSAEVEQLGPSSALQSMDATDVVAPLRTVTWFHVGAPLDLRDEYSDADPQAAVLEPVSFDGCAGDADGLRAVRGATLRVESYSEDAAAPTTPLVVVQHAHVVRALAAVCPHGTPCHHVHTQQSLTYTYELAGEPAFDPAQAEVPASTAALADPRLSQSAVLELDDFGNALRTISVAYPRRRAVPEPKWVVPVEPPTPTPEHPVDAVVQVRLDGILFDEAKSFVLPQARPGLGVLAAMHRDEARGEVLVVGHTDREGKLADNDALSLQRAHAVAAFLRGDADAWLPLFDKSVPKDRRLGAHEEALMLADVGFAGDLAGFQRSAGLDDDGDMGPLTRRALIARYMRRDGGTGGAAEPGSPAAPQPGDEPREALLPEGTTIGVAAGGEHYPVVATDDDVAQAENRRTEVFMFAAAIEPPVPTADGVLGPDAPAYATWTSRGGGVVRIDATTGDVLRPDGPGGREPPFFEPVDDDAVLRDGDMVDAQLQPVIVATVSKIANRDTHGSVRIGVVFETASFEVTGVAVDPSAPLSFAALVSAASGGSEIGFHAAPSGGPARRLLSCSRVLYCDGGDGKAALPLGVIGAFALPHHTLAQLDTTRAAALFDTPLAIAGLQPLPELLGAAGYVHDDGSWWAPSGRTVFDPAQFYLPVAQYDPFGTKVGETEYDAHRLCVTATQTLVAGGPPLRSDAIHDYRVLAPWATSDPNDTTVVVAYDALGRVIREVTRGRQAVKRAAKDFGSDAAALAKLGEEGDSHQHPTRRYHHDAHAFARNGRPTSTTAYVRLQHGEHTERVALSVTYFDGGGGVLQSRARTQGGKFRVSGRTIVNNKGLPVRTEAPTIASSQHYGDAPGKTMARMHYDALGRCVRVDHADGTHERTQYGAWAQIVFDRGDTAHDSEWLARQTKNDGSGAASAAVVQQAQVYAHTPTIVRYDVLGRPCATFSSLREQDASSQGAASGEFRMHATRQRQDVSGNVVAVVDARGNLAERREADMLGRTLRVVSADAGESLALVDAIGAPVVSVDAQGRVFTWRFDALRRPIEDWVHEGGRGVLLGKRVYGDGTNDAAHGEGGAPAGGRHRGRLLRVYDGAGETRFESYDMDGNATATTRRLVDLPRWLAEHDERPRVDWSMIAGCERVAEIDDVLASVGVLEDGAWATSAEHDALGRATLVHPPLGASQRRHYTDDGLLERIERDDRLAGGELATVYQVDAFDHLGRPLLVQHGGAATTRLSYDGQTERLVSCSSVAANGTPLQGLSYTHDALGNIVRIADASRPAVYAGNAKHAAVNDYRYDALYRLVEATGREHIGQIDGKTPRASAPVVAAEPNDAGALRQYVQRYRYDAAGNLLRLEHAAGAGSYTRVYAYGDRGNRLRATGRHEAELFERYRHDAGGHMLAMPHVDDLRWNEVGELDRVRIGTMTAYFQYAGGVRVRKYVVKGGSVVEDRRVVDGVEVFIKGKRGAYGAVQVIERTETEVFGDAGLRIDRKTKREGAACDVVHWRYALHDHLGSVAVEVDRAGKVISREEYHPWGTTAVRAVTSELGVSPRRHRYLARERDDETGLALHGARYYAPWLGRWTAADPIGLAGGFNRYAYCRGSPVTLRDVDGRAPEGSEWDDTMAAAPHRRDRAAERAEAKRAAQRAAEDALIAAFRKTLALEYEANLRVADRSRMKWIEGARATWLYPGGRTVDNFDPNDHAGTGAARVSEYASELWRVSDAQLKNAGLEARIAGLVSAHRKKLSGINWRSDLAEDLQLLDAAYSAGAGVAGQGLGVRPVKVAASPPRARPPATAPPHTVDLPPADLAAAPGAGGDIVYRALTAADAEALAAGRGLTAKAPSGTWTAAEHVANAGPGAGGAVANSPWISTTRSLDVARAYDSGHGIVTIDLSKVPSMQVEVWQHAPRANGMRGLPYHRSIWAQEVTIFHSIPFDAIVGGSR